MAVAEAGRLMAMPSVEYFLSTADHPIDEDHPLWMHPLPDNRHPGSPEPDAIDVAAVSYGQYCSAIQEFCAADQWQRLTAACTMKLQQPVAPKEIAGLRIYLEKHGAFYHPSRLHVTIGDKSISFVANVAVSDRGRRTLPREVQALRHLADKRPFGWFPQVYCSRIDSLPIFLADWFDDFHEFHLTRRFGSGAAEILLWDGQKRPRLLSEKQKDALYRNAAMILTASYDPISSCQIHPWHHAAGDFVIRLEGDRVAVKMVTVRDYQPLTRSASAPENERELLESIIVFFMHLSLRMRLDRYDGVSEVAWAPEACLVPMVKGFFQGLDLTARINAFPDGFPEAVSHFFNRHGETELLSIAERISGSVFDARSEERRVIQNNLEAHVDSIIRIMSA